MTKPRKKPLTAVGFASPPPASLAPVSAELARVERFWSNVDTSGSCWEWRGARSSSGYGSFTAGGTRMATHYAWSLHNGPVPEGMHVCHKCDNPPCVRPSHLFLGTHQDNMDDMAFKRAQRIALLGGPELAVNTAKPVKGWAGRTHCKNGHEYTVGNTRYFKGARCCRACTRAYRNLHRARKRAAAREAAGVPATLPTGDRA